MADRIDEAKLRDEQRIEKIRKKWDLNQIDDLEEVIGLLQSGSLKFETRIGMEFDDELFEKKQQLKSQNQSRKTKEHKKTLSSIKKNRRLKQINEEKLNKYEKRRRIIMGICISVAVLSLGYFSYYCYYAYKSSKEFEKLADLKESSFSLYRPFHMQVDEKPDAPDILEEYSTLYIKNKSLIGWLTIDGTAIDYPVMQSKNEEYYLDHNFDQKKDRNGSLFLDADCSIWPRSQNLIIYGHNMKSGKMFGTLSSYKSESYFKKHPTILFDSLYEKGEYQVMYVFSEIVHDEAEVTFKYYQFIDANSAEEYASNMEEMKKKSLYDTEVTSSYGDKLITLSTCDYAEGAERFAVVAKKIK